MKKIKGTIDGLVRSVIVNQWQILSLVSTPSIMIVSRWRRGTSGWALWKWIAKLETHKSTAWMQQSFRRDNGESLQSIWRCRLTIQGASGDFSEVSCWFAYRYLFLFVDSISKMSRKKTTTQRSNNFSSEKKRKQREKQKQNRYSWHRQDRDQYSNILRLRRSRKAQFYVHCRSISSSRIRAHEEKRGTIHWVSKRVHSLSSREAWSFQVNNCAVATRRETERERASEKERRKRPKKIKIILQSTYTHARTTSERGRKATANQ